MNKLLITNGRVIDPSQNMDRVTNLLVVDGRIAAYDAEADAAPDQGRRKSSTPRGGSSRRG